MALSFEKCELLCYVQNNYSSATKSGIVTAVSGFYSNDEISDAKIMLYDIIDKLRESGCVPPEMKNRMINRKHGDQKRRLDTQDLLALFADIDAHKIPIPVFVAANLQRIPPFAPDATDFCSLAFNVNQMQSQMASLEKDLMTALNDAGVFRLKVQVNAIDERLSKCIEVQKAVESCVNPAPSNHPTLQCTLPPTVAPEIAATESESWAANGVPSISDNPPVVPGCSNDTGNNSWVTVAARNRPSRPVMPVRVKGSRSDVSLKTVPRKKAVLSAYVGRLDPTTSAEELTT